MDTASENGTEPNILLSYADNAPEHTILFIHGYPLSSVMWAPQLDGLAGVAYCVAPDLRGFGESGTPGGAVSMADYADDCIALLDDLELDDPVVVCGLSMGGYVALELQRRHPDRVAALILASTKAGADSDEAKAGRDKAARAARDEGPEAVAATMLPKMLAAASYAEDPDLVADVNEIMRQASVEGIVGALGAMRDRIDSTPLLGAIDVPTLVIHGRDDTLMPIAEGEKLAAGIPDAHFLVVDDAGHLVNLEQEDVFNQAVFEFLAVLSGSQAED